MSYSTLVAISRTVATPLAKYQNGRGTSLVHDYLSEVYLREPPLSYKWQEADHPIWRLAMDQRVPLPLRACHIFTFDGAMIPRRRTKEMARLLDEGGALLARERPGCVNHFPAIARSVFDAKLHHRALGLGLNCTSICETFPRERRRWAVEPWDCYEQLTGVGSDHG